MSVLLRALCVAAVLLLPQDAGAADKRRFDKPHPAPASRFLPKDRPRRQLDFGDDLDPRSFGGLPDNLLVITREDINRPNEQKDSQLGRRAEQEFVENTFPDINDVENLGQTVQKSRETSTFVNPVIELMTKSATVATKPESVFSPQFSFVKTLQDQTKIVPFVETVTHTVNIRTSTVTRERIETFVSSHTKTVTLETFVSPHTETVTFTSPVTSNIVSVPPRTLMRHPVVVTKDIFKKHLFTPQQTTTYYTRLSITLDPRMYLKVEPTSVETYSGTRAIYHITTPVVPFLHQSQRPDSAGVLGRFSDVLGEPLTNEQQELRLKQAREEVHQKLQQLKEMQRRHAVERQQLIKPYEQQLEELQRNRELKQNFPQGFTYVDPEVALDFLN